MAFYTWHKIADPTVGWLASMTTGWTADSFSGGLEVDFSAVVPVGTKAVLITVVCLNGSTANGVATRAAGDSNISNTPFASNEFSAQLATASQNTRHIARVWIWLSTDMKADFAVYETGNDLYISYPAGWLG